MINIINIININQNFLQISQYIHEKLFSMELLYFKINIIT